ncbi:tetratricopeptide repeat protein [Nocardioides carbamazepini]|uniref:tetratricopeptide repeat protein n=1 Tax=Nocardioides carbamazepini TaxID=2854259 RepID=UPI00214A2CAA|nr:tetratricopeptide repeat protein [Nocardioides carbamazepini]MCR1783392.1 tetratricopeptide repeat protein [Nocardioides carbamazepini]
MADQRGRRDGAGAPRKGGGPRQGGAPRKGTSARSGGGRSGDDRKPYDRKPSSERQPPGGRKPAGHGGGKPASDNRRGPRAESDRKPRFDGADRTEKQAVYDGPPLPEDVSGAELSASVRAHLKGLPEKLAARVARHMAAAGQLVDDDPETAYQHTLAAKARAPRIAVVREAVGEAAYAAGHYAEALAELRAAKRMNGATAYLPIMADCHRALGNPTRALELAKSPSVVKFVPAAKAEMTLVEAGARRDLGQLDAALRTLEVAPLNSKSRESWVARLRYAYADTLEEAGRLNDALTWFHKTNAIDSEEITDAADRAEALEKRIERE